MERFRFDEYGAVFEWSEEQHAYLFYAKLNGQSKEQFLSEESE